MHEHDEIADRAEAGADRMAQHIDELASHVNGAREHWAAAKADPAVPGAQPDDQPQHDQPPVTGQSSTTAEEGSE